MLSCSSQFLLFGIISFGFYMLDISIKRLHCIFALEKINFTSDFNMFSLLMGLASRFSRYEVMNLNIFFKELNLNTLKLRRCRQSTLKMFSHC